jgi:hypothetical protein
VLWHQRVIESWELRIAYNFIMLGRLGTWLSIPVLAFTLQVNNFGMLFHVIAEIGVVSLF